jgi:hypothetical protein
MLRGDLERAFNEGDMTIKEALLLVAVDQDDSYVVQHDYIIDDDGEFVLTEVHEIKAGPQSTLVDVCKKAISLSGKSRAEVIKHIIETFEAFED